MPVVFEEQHFCVSLCTVHSSLLNFQFDPVGLAAVGVALALLSATVVQMLCDCFGKRRRSD